MSKGPVDLLDLWLKNQLWVDRLQLESEKSLVWDLNQARKQLIALILDGDTHGRYRRILSQAESMIYEVYDKHKNELYPELQVLAKQSYDWATVALNSHAAALAVPQRVTFDRLPKPAIKMLYDMDSLILPAGGGKNPNDTKAYFLKDLVSGEKAVEKLRSTLASGLIMGSSNQSMERSLREWSGLQVNASRAIVRTAVASVMERSRVEAFAAFSEITMGFKWISVFDGRTTMGCRALHNKRFKEEKDAPPRPRHFRCRSILVPLTKLSDKEGEEIGSRPSAVHDKRTVEHRDGTTSTQFKVDRSRSGPIPKNMTQDEWFRARLTEAEQIDYLGKRRYELFNQGKLKFSDLVGKDWSPLTIKQIEAKMAGQLPLRPAVNILAPKTNEWATGLNKKFLPKDAPLEVRNTIDRLDQPTRAQGRGSISFSRGDSIYMAKGSESDTWLHEYGHHVDKQLGQRRTGKLNNFISSTDEYKKAVLLDAEKIVSEQKKADPIAELIAPKSSFNDLDDLVREKMERRVFDSVGTAKEKPIIEFISRSLGDRESLGKILWDALSEDEKSSRMGYRALYLHDVEDYRYLLGVLSNKYRAEGRLQGYINLADLLGSTTLNKVGWGHKDSYYKTRPPARFTENFANLFNALSRGENSLDWKLAQRFAPNSARELLLKLREIDDE